MSDLKEPVIDSGTSRVLILEKNSVGLIYDEVVAANWLLGGRCNS